MRKLPTSIKYQPTGGKYMFLRDQQNNLRDSYTYDVIVAFTVMTDTILCLDEEGGIMQVSKTSMTAALLALSTSTAVRMPNLL